MASLPLARKIAKHVAIKIPRAEYSEIYADAQLALVLAFDAFDPERGVPFEHFAQSWIRGYILNGIRHRSPISERNSTILRRSQEVWSQFAIEHGRTPKIDEMEAIMPGISRAMREAYERPAIPLDEAIAEIDSRLYERPESAIVLSERESALHDAIASLEGRHREVIELAHGIALTPLGIISTGGGLTISAIAELWQCPRQHVSNIHQQAFFMLALAVRDVR